MPQNMPTRAANIVVRENSPALATAQAAAMATTLTME